MIDDDEYLIPSLSNDEANLFNSSDNEDNVCDWFPVEEVAFPIVTCLVTSSLREGCIELTDPVKDGRVAVYKVFSIPRML